MHIRTCLGDDNRYEHEAVGSTVETGEKNVI